MRMITACFARALQRWTSRTGMHCLLTFQEVMPINKTRNQLIVENRVGLFDLLLRLGLHDLAQPKAHPIQDLGHRTGRGQLVRALPLFSQRL